MAVKYHASNGADKGNESDTSQDVLGPYSAHKVTLALGCGANSSVSLDRDGSCSLAGFSNITSVFGMPASGHFGSQAINGAVRRK
ncbi:MAG: hypothetical protein WBV69_17450 [Candidatus Sulfotelmatobacter sp.]